MSFELDAEIFAVGKWNGIDITPKMLKELEANFTALSDILDVPLKIGHEDEQALKDGDQMALGWIDKVWIDGQKLFAHFKGIPKVVFDAIDKELFKNVSIEALFDVTHKGQNYGTVLTAVALLGVEMPAVNTLSDLKAFMTAKNLSFSKLATFSKKPTVNDERNGIMPMTTEEQAEFNRLTAENKALNKINVDSATKFATESAEHAALKTTVDTMKKEGKDKEFAAAKQSVTEDLEALVKAKKVTPAKRDELLKDMTPETVANIQFTANILKDVTANVNPGDNDTGHDSSDDDNDDDGLTAGDKVVAKANSLVFSNKNMKFSAAVNEVLRGDKKLARAYADENDKEDA